MLCGGRLPPTLDGWVCEPKWDGVRTVVTVDAGRRGAAQPPRQRRHRRVPGAGTPGRGGRPAAPGPRRGGAHPGRRAGARRSSLLQHRMHVRRPPAELVARIPVRMRVLRPALGRRPRPVRPPAPGAADPPRGARHRGGRPRGCRPRLPALPADELLDVCRHAGMEGFVAKHDASPYLPGRSDVASGSRPRRCAGESSWSGAGRRASTAGRAPSGRWPWDGWTPTTATPGPTGPACAGPARSARDSRRCSSTSSPPWRRRFARAESPFLDAPRGARIRGWRPCSWWRSSSARSRRPAPCATPRSRGRPTCTPPTWVPARARPGADAGAGPVA